MKDQATAFIAALNRQQKREVSRFNRLGRKILFALGFSKCKHCIYCNFDGDKYRGMRESVLISNGQCHWSKDSASATLTNEDLGRFHRCPAFIPILYNFKDYGIDPREIERIRDRRRAMLITWAGWFVAVIVALFNYWLRVRNGG